MHWLAVSLFLFSLWGFAENNTQRIKSNVINNKELDAILERIAEIDTTSKLNSIIDRIIIEDKGATIKRKRKIIIVDAGHGGKDPGTVGTMGTVEKEIVLQYSILLAKTLKDAGYTVFLTRSNDTYISLVKRRKLAQEYSGSLMVSLHADSAGNVKARGLSVYTLSDEATDSVAKMLASANNDKGDIVFKSSVRDNLAKAALINLAQNSTISRSEYFARILLNHAKNNRLFLITRPHRKAGFAVLKMPDVPSVLIELGFLSSPEEEILLRSPPYRNQMIQTIFKSIDEFFGIEAG